MSNNVATNWKHVWYQLNKRSYASVVCTNLSYPALGRVKQTKYKAGPTTPGQVKAQAKTVQNMVPTPKKNH